MNNIITTGHCQSCNRTSVIVALQTVDDRSNVVSGRCPMCGAAGWVERSWALGVDRVEFTAQLAELLGDPPCAVCGANPYAAIVEELELELESGDESIAAVPLCRHCMMNCTVPILLAKVLESTEEYESGDGSVTYSGHGMTEVERVLRAALRRHGRG